jgi:hypothetical protein
MQHPIQLPEDCISRPACFGSEHGSMDDTSGEERVRKISRRALLGGAAALTAGGVAVIVGLVSRHGNDRPAGNGTPISPTSTPTPITPTATVPPTSTPGPISSIPLKPLAPEEFDHIVLASGEPAPWSEGIYFLQPDGSVEAYTLGPNPFGGVQHSMSANGEFVVARRSGADEELGALISRDLTYATAWDEREVHFAGLRMTPSSSLSWTRKEARFSLPISTERFDSAFAFLGPMTTSPTFSFRGTGSRR